MYPMTDKAGTTFIDKGARVYRYDLAGSRTNDDTWVKLGPVPHHQAIIDGLIARADAGGKNAAIERAFTMLYSRQRSLVDNLRDWVSPEQRAEVATIRRAERASVPVFWVHLRNARHGRPSREVPGGRAVLCALASCDDTSAPPLAAVVTLTSRKAIDNWRQEGASVTAPDLTWLYDQV